MTSPGFTQYSTVAPLIGTLPGWVEPIDQQRIAAYEKYEQLFWSAEEGFDEVLRGDNENPIFLPTAKTLVQTVNRYTAPAFTYALAPVEGVGADSDVDIARLALEALWTREGVAGKFSSNKLNGLVKGDWLWHLHADPEKPLGSRITVDVVMPNNYFPVYDITDTTKIVAVHLAELVSVNGEAKVSRMTYTKAIDGAGLPLGVLRSHGIFKTDGWWAQDAVPEEVILAEEMLPEEFQAIPVFHIKNGDSTLLYGSSELRGLESVLIGLNQSISDEDLALAMEGLGLYATDGRGPVDAQGNETEWIMGPGRVLTSANGLRRISGVTSVSPYQSHLDRLEKSAKESVGASDVAVGQVDGATAESGIAVLLKLGPILSLTGEKDLGIAAVMGQLLYNLLKFLAVYEELPLLNGTGAEAVPKVLCTPQFGSKVPINLKAVVDQVTDLRNAVTPIISLETAHNLLRAAGMPLPDNELALLEAEAQKAAEAAAAAFGGDPGATADADADAELTGAAGGDEE